MGHHSFIDISLSYAWHLPQLGARYRREILGWKEPGTETNFRASATIAAIRCLKNPRLWSLATLISASKLFSDLPHLDHDGSALHVTRQRLSKLVHRLHSESVPGWVAAGHHCCHHHHHHHLCYLFSTRPYSICSILNIELPSMPTYHWCWVRLDDLCIYHLLSVLMISVSIITTERRV